MSLHRLLGAGLRVKWDWLAPLAALVAFMKIVTQWWTWHGAEQLAGAITFEMFLALLVGAVLLFLLAAAALPDEVRPEERVDLAAHYQTIRRQYWSLFLSQWAVGNAASAWIEVKAAHARFALWQPGYLLVLLIASMIVVKNRWWHTAALIGFVVVYLAQFFGRTLS